MKFTWLKLLLGLCLTAFLASSAYAQREPGQIRVSLVKGEVVKVAADGSATTLKRDDMLMQSDAVKTGKGARAIIVFANGSTLTVGSDSLLKIQEFMMDPLEKEINVADLKAEPNVSRTKLELAYGEVVGEVKKLNTAGGSTYNIATPVGAAGIRGTTFRIVFRPSGDGKNFTFQLSTAEGVVVFEGVSKGSGAALDVPQDQEIVITGDIDAAGNITFNEPPATTPLSPEAKTQIQEVQQEVKQTVQQSPEIFTPAPAAPPEPAPKQPDPTPGAGKT